MTEQIPQRVAAIRQWLEDHHFDAFIIPRADEYLGEYVPAHNERLHWATGFTGSAGVAIVLREQAAIFIDGRYTVQVAKQVPSPLFSYQSLTDTPHLPWLIAQLKPGQRIAVDARLHPDNWWQQAERSCAEHDLQLVAIEQNPIDSLWLNRPQPNAKAAILFSEQRAGATSLAKRLHIADLVRAQHADALLVSSLDAFCWLLNIRGHDVPRLPVILGCAILHRDGRCDLYTDLTKLPDGFQQHVGAGVHAFAESQLAQAFSRLSGKTMLADPAQANAWLHLQARAAGVHIKAASDPITLVKAQKNPQELHGMQQSHIRDGRAVSRFLCWLDREVSAGRFYDEGQLADQLESYRKQDPLYLEPSFDTISAAGGNAAMCHYNHQNAEQPAMLPNNSLYLVDSGAQYLDGTTDVTRTVVIGEVSDEHKRLFTLVLKGHIALATARFPKGTCGQQLDCLARQYLWQQGFDYDHGTGHGVGHCLSVHEGPQRIGKTVNSVALLPGMVLSNEPGYYRADSPEHTGFGIRIENLVVVEPCPALSQAERETYHFRDLTMIPIDRRAIMPSLLTEAEIHWLNGYHQQVYQALVSELAPDEQRWLASACQAL